jgi:hypothetical protein
MHDVVVLGIGIGIGVGVKSSEETKGMLRIYHISLLLNRMNA